MTKDWFTSRVGRTVRFTFDYLGTKIDKQRTIKDDREAGYLWLMSERGYKFEEVNDDWLEAAKPSLRIHRKPFVECESCSA